MKVLAKARGEGEEKKREINRKKEERYRRGERKKKEGRENRWVGRQQCRGRTRRCWKSVDYLQKGAREVDG